MSTNIAEPEISDDDGNVERARHLLTLADKEGYLEAPVGLNIGNATRIELNPLAWYNHNVAPKKLKLTNTGYTGSRSPCFILSAKWLTERPYLIDGPFLDKYVFSQLHFHWGENDMNGSEHRIDGARMPMELHAVYFKAMYRSQEEAQRHRDGLAILVYLFRLQISANPVLASVVQALPQIRDPGVSKRLDHPEPLVNLTRPFSDDYLLYWGALPGAGERRAQPVLWLVSREPIAVSHEQIEQFRSLLNTKYEPLLCNCRTPSDENLQAQNVFHANPSGKSYATLLPIPRDPPLLTANQVAEIVANYKESAEE